ncbi:phosphatase PAP2 family protein [Thalassiella azotivora]
MRRPGEPAAPTAGPDPDEEYVGGRDLTYWPTAAGRWVVTAAGAAVRWATPRWALLLTLALGLGFAAVMGLLAGEVYESVAESDGVAGLDRPLLDAAVDARTPTTERLVTAYTDLGGPVGMTVIAVVATLGLSVWPRRRLTPVVLMVVATAGSLLMTVAGKAAVGRVRPPLVDAVPPYEESASFPSGHSLNSVVVAGVLAYVVVRRLDGVWARFAVVTAAAAFAATMGLSRVYLGHHWLTDVLVAWALGLAWLSVVVTGHRVWLTLRRRGTTPPPPTGGPPAGSGGRRD